MNELKNSIVEDALDIIKINASLRLIGHVIGGLFYFPAKYYKVSEECYDHCGVDYFLLFFFQGFVALYLPSVIGLPLDLFYLIASITPKPEEFAKNKLA